MDPLSVTASVAGIAGVCLATAKTLSDLRSKYKNAQMTIVAICSETTVIGVTLAKIQGILLSNPQALTAHIQAVPGLELEATFNIAITGCRVIYSCLDIEVQRLKAHASQAEEPGWTEKAKLLWKDDTMKCLLGDLRGQQASITLLISVLQVEKIADIHRLIEEKSITDILESTAFRTRSLRTTYPQSTVPESIFETEYNLHARFEDAASFVGSSIFDFDDDVVNSHVYRRTLASVKQLVNEQNERGTTISKPITGVDFLRELTDDNASLSPNNWANYQAPPTSQSVQRTAISSTVALRRCSPSIIGLWATATRRKFRTSDFRFEVVFETPVIFLTHPDNSRGPILGRQIHYIDGTENSYINTRVLGPGAQMEADVRAAISVHTADDERSSWVILLSTLQRQETDSRKWDECMRNALLPSVHIAPVEPEYTLVVGIQRKTRSWDFIPTAITRPYATSAICHLVEMVAMIGMYWKVFDQTLWNLQAEGNGFTMTSTNVQGLGVIGCFYSCWKDILQGKQNYPLKASERASVWSSTEYI